MDKMTPIPDSNYTITVIFKGHKSLEFRELSQWSQHQINFFHCTV